MYRRIDCGALSVHGQAFVFIINAIDRTFAAERCQDIAVLAGKLNSVIHILLDFGHFAEISVNISFGFLVADINLFCQTKLGNAVDNAEINRFGVAALVWRYFIQRHAENTGSRGGMNILIFGKRMFQPLYIRNHRQQAQLNL